MLITLFGSVSAVEFSVPVVLGTRSYPFAHEGPVYHSESNSVFFTSNRNGQNTNVSRLYLDSLNIEENIAPEIPMPNGAFLLQDKIYFCGQGTYSKPAGIYEFDISSYSSSPSLLSAFSKNFNSLNDIVISGSVVWFTDPTYGFAQGFRPPPEIDAFVWRAVLNSSGIFHAVPVLDGFDKPNGLVLSNDGLLLYVTDTGYATGTGTDESRPRCVYSFVVTKPHNIPTNKKLFTCIDNGIPDGLKIDNHGYIYIGSGDGVRVYSEDGNLVSLVPVVGGVANFVIVGNSLIMMAETRIIHSNIRY